MALSTFSVRMDENIKKQFDSLCSDFGLTPSAAFNVFAKAVIRERKIPFEIVAPKLEMPTRESGYNAFMLLRKAAKENGMQDWSLEQINAEISAARRDKETGV